MPFAPDPPFPKSPGHPIVAKDWNDSINELLRLDTAKLNKAGGAVTGPLTIAAALGVGTATPAAGARLHVVDSANPVIARLQSTASFGAARLEMWTDPQGANEWRPGYIESFDTGGWTGGLKFVTNGTGSANKTGSSEQLRLWNGRAGFGVTDPGFRIDALGRIRLRDGGGTAGLWLYHSGAADPKDRAFIGMASDTAVGLWGNTGAQWGLQMDTSNGNLGVRQAPGTTALSVNGDSLVSGSSSVMGNAAIGHNAPGFRLDVNGRSRFRDGGGTAGLWLYHSGAADPKDRAFVGMAADDAVGFWGSTGAQWGLRMNTTTGNVGIRQAPDADALSVGGNVQVTGRVWANNHKLEAMAAGWTWTNSNSYVLISGMQLVFTLAAQRPVWISFHMPGVQMATVIANGTNLGGDGAHGAAVFHLTVDGGEICFTRQEWHNNGWELRSVVLTRLVTLAAGTHTVRAEWAGQSGVLPITGCWYGEQRTLQVFEL